MKVERCTAPDADWAAIRAEMWPGADDDVAMVLARGAVFLVRDEHGVAMGFAEAAIRRDYVNGCETSPVAFLEGIFVRPEARKRGAARRLVAAVADWARGAGMSELASDALTSNPTGLAMHQALGFAETERVVFFRKRLALVTAGGAGAGGEV